MQSTLPNGNRAGIATAPGEPDQLAYLVHDMRSVATSVSLMVDLLALAADARDDSTQRARVVSAQKSCHQMAQLCARIAEHMMGATDADSEPEKFGLFELLVEAVVIYSPIFDLAGKTLRLETRRRPLRFFGNRSQILRAVSNLLDNGLKHTSNGSAVVIACSEGMEEFVVSISDDGPGFAGLETGKVQPIDTLPVVVKHVSNSASIFMPGTGLRYVSETIASYGGESKVELNERGGSSFSLIFPKQRVEGLLGFE